ncbi:uncharacterized protein LOC143287409 [Babylonia areolata]|uniref:uncharacterized protein LOC143287409 n=1 Tax=Babylonia areolata TaxID=304850 RepID=UPI003FD54692
MVHLNLATFLAAVCVLAMMLSMSDAVPLEVSDNADDIKRSLVYARLLGAADRLKGSRQDVMEEGNLAQFSGVPYTQHKRQRPSVQSRSGGMSLCLWKVCPAAPWLVSKRDGNDY